MITVTVNNQNRGIDRLPDVCPICRYSIHPVPKQCSAACKDNLVDIIEVVMQCPREKCSRLFIARYYRNAYSTFSLFHSVPVTPIDPVFSDGIKALSPNFVTICSQSAHAEEIKLDQVCGCGYRKALEFLIKDYCISLYPDRTEEIKKLPLGACNL